MATGPLYKETSQPAAPSPIESPTLKRVAVALAVAALIGGASTLLGWFGNVPRLTDWVATDIPMFANTAGAAVLASVALLLRISTRGNGARAASVLGLIVACLGLATLFEHLSGVNLGFDTLIVNPSYGHRAAVAVGRMGPPAATSFLLLGLAVVFAAGKSPRMRRIAAGLALFVLAVCTLSIIGYVFNADPLFATAKLTAIALQTAVIIATLALALLVSMPDMEPVRTVCERTAAGSLIRRALPFAIIIPVLFGWMYIEGRRYEMFDRGLGTAALVIFLTFILCSLLAWCAADVKNYEEKSRANFERMRHAEQEARAQREQLQTVFDNTPECVKMVSRDGTLLAMNRSGLCMVEADGLERVLGGNIYEVIAPEFRDTFRRMNERVCSGSKEALEFQIVGLKGTRRWLETHATPFHNTDGELVQLAVTRDITDRKKAELDLAKANKQLAAFLETAAVGLHRVAEDGTILWANAAEMDMLGYKPEEYIGHHIAEFHADQPVIDDILKRLVCGERLFGYEARLRCKDGSVKHVQIDSSVLREDGKFIHTQCFTRDVTAYKEAVDALRDNERRLAELIEAMPAAVYTTDAQGRITMFNQAAVEFAGRTPTIGSDEWCVTWKLYWPDGTPLPHDQCPMAIALKEGRPVRGYEAIAERPDGTRVHFMPFPTPLRNKQGEVVGAINMLVDITERKRAEEASAKLAAIVEGSGDAIVSKDLNGIIQSWNKSAERHFGYTAEEIIGKHVTTLIPSDRQDEESTIISRIRSGYRVEHFETIRQRKDGSLFDASLTISPIRDGSGKIIGASKILRDVSERKRIELELQKTKASLEQKVAERTASLKETTDQLETFCYTIAHDLRSPLRAQQSYAQALLDEYKEVIGETGTTYAERIVRSAKRLDQLVIDLLAYSRLSREDLQYQTVDMNGVAMDVRSALAEEIRNSRATLSVAPLLPVHGYEPTVNLILMNLVSNALKFVDSDRAPAVKIWSEARGSFVRVWVEDNGIGIDAEYLEKIFGVFQRLHATDKYPGTGIGLAIVQKGVERMGGKIGVESQPAIGSRFWFELPVPKTLAS
jgi:PAS domain S-box-containing protein